MTHRVFVYGSLKRGHWNYSLLRDYHAEFKGETVTEQRYHMLSGRIQLSGRFPVVMDDDPAPSARPVTGEIYHVSDECLEQLDRLERVPESYERREGVSGQGVHLCRQPRALEAERLAALDHAQQERRTGLDRGVSAPTS